ncbi:bifunctional diguanylate cyclase/phosphodiesterase [Deinococcus sp. RIT780]|uniref:putative bifunctional diguanylate cyclase/phosphodiesterase n=1 Tax=Deinococcus sp. RIT780 TaxID=2870472 RepID=UPI001C8AE0B8|nr:EAL domain-containing protein [Deinococcus sp. RIT780]MBX8465246.1 EAL domain-containing protein [Deinococcus sp. RIT780]
MPKPASLPDRHRGQDSTPAGGAGTRMTQGGRRRWWWTGPDGPGQSLRVQVLILLGVLALPTLLVLLVVIPALMETRFRHIEREQVAQYSQIAREDLITEEERVSLFTLNFSQWTSTFDFSVGRNPGFEADAFGMSTFMGGRVDYAGVTAPDGRIVTALRRDGSQVLPAGPTVRALLAQLPSPLPGEGAQGIVLVGARPYLMAARPITRDDGSGRGGVMLFARLLSQTALGQLMHSSGTFTAQLAQLPAEGQSALTFRPREVIGISALEAPVGPPQLGLQLTIPRAVHLAGQDTLWQLRGVILLVTLTALLAFMLFLNRRVLRVLTRYVADTQRIARDPTHRLESSNRTELGVLARTINDLLDHLQGREAQLRERVLRDELTGAYSRAGLAELLQEDASVRSALLIEVPRLQELSGLYGNAFVDRLIRELADRLGNDDQHVVGRISSSGLALITRAPAQIDPAQMLTRLEEPFALREGEVTLKLVAGYSESIYPVPFSALLRQASLALQHAIDQRDHLGVFDERMLRRSQYGHTLETQLQGAAQRQELSLMYQPISDVDTGRWVAIEALLRWQHPLLGAVPPGTFIPVAERSGQIYQLGDWALQTALRETEAARALWPEARVNVNVSPVQLLMPDYAERVLQTLADLQVSAHLLTVEVTESTVMQDVDLACRHLRKLREAGVRVALDDFGSGHSSLSLLTDLPLDIVKLDRSFLREGAQETARGALLRNTIRLARDLQLSTVAEGVEDAGMLTLLRDLGCDYAQGYHISRPDHLEDLLSLRR